MRLLLAWPDQPRRDQSEVLSDILVTVRDIERRLNAGGPLAVGLHSTLAADLGNLTVEQFKPLTSLVSITGRRTVRELGEFEAPPELVEMLTKMDVITVSERQGKQLVEIAHDAIAHAVFSLIPSKYIDRDDDAT